MEIDFDQINKNTLGEVAGIKMIELKEGYCELRMPVDKRHHQPLGMLHGGVSVVLAETAASLGGWFVVKDKNQYAVGQEINANHLKPVRDGFVRAKAKAVHLGKKSQVWQIEIHHEETQKLICISRCTLAVMDF